MIFNGEKTIYNTVLQNRMLTKQPFYPIHNTTLNEKFNILTKYTFTDNEIRYPSINLLVIGTNFLEPNIESTKLQLKLSKHSATDAALYNHIPFYLRKASDNDTTTISNRYKLKTLVEINGEDYIAYYGYEVKDFFYKDDILQYNNINEEYANMQKFDTNTYELLNPVINQDSNLEFKPNKYVSDFIKLYMFFSKQELDEILNVFQLLYPNETQHKITELGVCSSIFVDKDINYKEAVWTQVNYFLDCDLDIDDGVEAEGMDFYIEIGGMEIIRDLS